MEKPINDNTKAAQPTFTCVDCDIDVYAFGPVPDPLPKRCMECDWIANIDDPVARERLRKFLKDRNI